MARRHRVPAGYRAALAIVLGALCVIAIPGPSRAASYPPLPVEYGRELLGNLSAPSLAPGTSGSISFRVGNPLVSPIANVEVTLEVYAFNAFPGNATSTVPVAGAPVLSTAGSSGAGVNVSLPALDPGASYAGSVGVASAASTPSGTFAIRTALSFESNGTAYRLESRGWFTAAAWAAATEEPNGSVTLNLSQLGVSGVTPETAVLIAPSTWGWILGGLLAAAIGLTGVAAWVYFRRGPGSRSGAR